MTAIYTNLLFSGSFPAGATQAVLTTAGAGLVTVLRDILITAPVATATIVVMSTIVSGGRVNLFRQNVVEGTMFHLDLRQVLPAGGVLELTQAPAGTHVHVTGYIFRDLPFPPAA